MKLQFADIHVHPSLKPFNNKDYPSGEGKTIWDRFKKREEDLKKLNLKIRGDLEELAKSSQANLDACVETNLVCPFFALYPTERQWFDPQPKGLYKPIFWLLISPRKYHHLGAAASGFPTGKVKKIMCRIKNGIGIDYFNKELLPLMEYTIDQTNITSQNHPEYSFKIATSYDEFKKYTQPNSKTICGILTIEGGSALGNYLHHDTFKKEFGDLETDEKELLEESFKENITKIKSWREGKYTPFFISFCHHFNSLLAGHARSLSPIFFKFFDQKPEMNEGFNELGKNVLELLLRKDNGRRILIDTKHMSIKSRMYYHNLVKDRRKEGDRIPIIQSHAAINGWESFNEAIKYSEDKKLNKNAYFSRWRINMNDEEILDIYDSDGIVGIVFHEGRMPGGLVKDRTKKYRKWFNKLKEKENMSARQQRKFNKVIENLKLIYNELLWSNIFHIVRLIHKNRKSNGEPANGWNIISIGSDYDGLVDPFNVYFSVKDFQTLFQDMMNYIKRQNGPIYYSENGKRQEFKKEEIEELMFG
ncbi:MAG: hypothetical protein KAU83_10980, partial [Bacteroidales bacterium]|nr:hypothetical protein [Bacteroidales bacterium]